MKTSLWFSSPIGALLLLGVEPSEAVVVTATYSGTVSNSSDGLGIFGPADGKVDDQSFVLTEVFDTSLGPNYIYSSAISNLIQGGSANGNLSPSLGATLTLGAGSATWSGSYHATIKGYNDGSFSQQFHYTIGDNGSDYVSASVVNYSAALPVSITMPFSFDVGPDDTGYGYFLIFGPGFNAASYGQLNMERLTVSIGAVPLPAALPLFASGLGLIGLLGFRSRRRESGARQGI